MNATAKTKLAPVTITITDQKELRRLHRVARSLDYKPEELAKLVFRSGLWDWAEVAKTTGKA